MEERVPIVFGFVFVMAFALLLVTFRSIVIPLKAILLNLLSVGAAYGVVVWIFQEEPPRVPARLRVDGRSDPAWLPLFMFVLLFGLSMDYHVFILSRVREAPTARCRPATLSRTGSRPRRRSSRRPRS